MGKLFSIETRIRDRSEKGVGVFSDQPVDEGRTVWIVEGADPSEQKLAAVRYCRPRFGRWKIGLVFVLDERRNLERQPVEGEAKLSWGYIAAEAFHCEAKVLNISAVGVMVEVDRPVPVDARARLEGPNLECMGYVRHCTPKGDLFLVGMQLAAAPIGKGSSEREVWAGLSLQYP